MPELTRVRCVCLTGPTACGKTELALRLAETVPLEIISMDSAMVYRGLDVGTAKPSAEVLRSVPHHLIDILEPTDAYSAGRFARDATAAILAVAQRGRLPLLVGGTLLYLRALRDGLAALPRADATVRARLDAEGARSGWPALHARLRGVDAEAAARVAPTDRQRIQRALEVHELTGHSITDLQRRAAPGSGLEVHAIALVPEDRAQLAERIERRFDAMVDSGFVAEVEALRRRGDLAPSMPAMRAVGYRQIWAHLDGACDWPETRRRAVIATRQLAKRQLTWLRGDARCERWPAFTVELAPRLVASVARLQRATRGAPSLC